MSKYILTNNNNNNDDDAISPPINEIVGMDHYKNNQLMVVSTRTNTATNDIQKKQEMIVQVIDIDIKNGKMKLDLEIKTKFYLKNKYHQPIITKNSSYTKEINRTWCIGVSGIICLGDDNTSNSNEQQEEEDTEKEEKEEKKKEDKEKEEEEKSDSEKIETECMYTYDDLLTLLEHKDERSLLTVCQNCLQASTSTAQRTQHLLEQAYHALLHSKLNNNSNKKYNVKKEVKKEKEENKKQQYKCLVLMHKLKKTRSKLNTFLLLHPEFIVETATTEENQDIQK